MPTYVYPNNAELFEVQQKLLPVLTMADPIFDIMPIVNKDAHLVMWEQEDDYIGLQQLRGINGAPRLVQAVGGKRFQIVPGVYGDLANVDELEITSRRAFGDLSASPINISDLVMKRQAQLMTREINRIKAIGWTLIATGTFSVSGPDGLAGHTDTFSLQTFAGSDWSTVATATPLVDFRAAKLLQRGFSVSFGREAKAYANSTTVNRMLNNTNSSDLHGKRQGGGDTFNSLMNVNNVLLDNDLPMVVEYDGGYLNDSGTFVNFIPDDKVVLVGARTDGGRVAEYQMTRNANNPSEGPGAYTKVVDDPNKVPRCIEVHKGHNGGPAIYFPSAIVIMSV